MLAWIVSPITQYAALAVALLSFLVLFVSLKLEIAVVRRMLAQPSRVPEAAPVPAPAPAQAVIPVSAPHQGLPGLELNLTARAQALRMLARGESSSTVAAALRTPQNEVDLLLKLQNLRNISA